MLLNIVHRTTFVYDGKAHESVNEARLRPIDDASQTCLAFALRVTPDTLPREYDDFYGNTVHYFEVAANHARLTVEAESTVSTLPMEERAEVPTVERSVLLRSPDREMLAEFYTSTGYVALDDAFRREAQTALQRRCQDVWSDVRRLGEHIHRGFAYRPESTRVDTPATEVLERREGVCQDFAHVHLGLCRSLGIPARYVSGYFLNGNRPQMEKEASHAWIEAWVPGHGWAPYDPTHGRVADERYVKISTGRDYADIRPVTGTYRGPRTLALHVDVAVRQAAADPVPI